MTEEFLWVEQYRPKTVADTILPSSLKKTFQQFVDDNNVPNLLLVGSAGVGKTTIAKAMLDEIGADYIIINGSMNGNIDTLRTDIQNFASAVSFSGGRKYVILDEADYLNAQSTQPALRNFMEEFSKNCGFILTANFGQKIIDPLQSRCSVIQFKFAKEDRPALATQFFKRVCGILEGRGVEYDKKAVAGLVQERFPDWRRVINELQRYAGTGRIDSGILANMGEANLNTLFDHMKGKRFTDVRKWVSDNSDIDSAVLYRQLYDNMIPLLKSSSAAADAIIILAEYQYKECFVANSEINRVAALAEIMINADWK